MRLVAIFNCWDDWFLLRYAVDNIRKVVDGIIVIGSTHSNYGEYSPIPEEWRNDELHVREPKFNIPLHSETDKRNFGLDVARKEGYTHFITCDSDELYDQEEFLTVKQLFHVEPELQGIVCPLVCYFKSPTLCLGRDITLVPHIHKLTKDIRHEFNRAYPWAWLGNQIRIDPSRSLNIRSGVEYTEQITMHHFSWVRSDYAKKIRNSTARRNLERSNILNQLVGAKEGDYIDFYRKRLTRCPNRFGIHVTKGEGIIHKDL